MTFERKRWLKRGWIESDEGFAVFDGRDVVIYREFGRRMAITAEIGGRNEANIFLNSIGRWDDDPLHAVPEPEKQRIADNVKRALESQGLKVRLM